MCASAFNRWAALLLAVNSVLLDACGGPAQHRFGSNVTGLLFTPIDTTEGIHPARSVLLDPGNPFARAPLGTTTKWDLIEAGADVAAFYAFATALAHEPIGENQFYAAASLARIAATGAVPDPALKEPVRNMAIAAYQSVLDHFPDARGYDATGTTSYRLATPAYQAIIELGGKVQGDWILVMTSNGEQAVRASDPVPAEGP